MARRNIKIDRARESLDNGRSISKNICQNYSEFHPRYCLYNLFFFFLRVPRVVNVIPEGSRISLFAIGLRAYIYIYTYARGDPFLNRCSAIILTGWNALHPVRRLLKRVSPPTRSRLSRSWHQLLDTFRSRRARRMPLFERDSPAWLSANDINWGRGIYRFLRYIVECSLLHNLV